MRVYVNWETREIIGPSQVETIIDEKASEYINDESAFSDFLYENYTIEQVWRMDSRKKDNVLDDYSAGCRGEAEEWFDDNFCEYEVE